MIATNKKVVMKTNDFEIDPNVYFLPDNEMVEREDRTKELIENIKHLPRNRVLDIGCRSLLTKKIEDEFKVKIDNTTGDLDYKLIAPKSKYDLVICSHIIEHLMNPLFMVENIKKIMAENGNLVIAYPTRWTKKYHRHFHEIPKRDMWNLIAKAQMEIIRWREYNPHKNFPLYFGLRPYIRHWTDKNIVFVAKVTK